MTLSVIITAGVTAYDCSDYVVLHSVEIDEQLFNPESFKPNTNKAVLRLHRTCPYIDEIFAADGDISIAITADAIPVFSGYLTDNYTLKITARGGSDVELTAEDPGIRLLKKPWASTGGLYTSFSGKKVCDSADSANSFVHILAALAGVTVSSTVPTISDLLYFSVEDKSKSQYWDILEGVLFDFMHTFYFNASGELCLFAFGGLTGTPSTVVRSDATILQKSLGDAGIEIKKRFIQYKEVNVQYKEGELVTSAVVFRDTTGQGLTDCDIEIAAGGYYPTSCDASTYAYIDYFLDDGRDILAVTSATADFVVDTGITYEFTHIGKSAQIRFYNPTALPKHIRKLRVTGLNVYAVKADSTMTSNEGGGKKLEYEAKYLTENADAQSLANLLRYVYANSSALYTFRSYQGVLYPATDLYPSETLYPLGDTLELGGLIRLYDPLWTGLDVNCAIYRKKYTVGKAGATFEALGIGIINMGDASVYKPVAKPIIKPIVGQYPTQKALTTLSDTVDFDGQYGVYGGQRYIGTKPTTWTLDDAGQTIADAAQAAAQAYADGLADTIQTQIDRAIVYFTQAGDPSSAWTADEKKEHTGDYWRTATGAVWYQWSGAAWVEISDPVAQQAADDAQTTADDKITVWADLATAQANALANDLFLTSGLLYRCLSDAAATYERITPKRWPDGTTLPTAETHEPLLTGDTFYKTDTHQWYVYTTSWEADGEPQLIESDVAALIPIYEPAYLGAHLDGTPLTAKNGDSYLRYSPTSGDENRGVFTYDGTTWTRTTDPIYVYKALADIVFICQLKDTDGTTALYGVEADYGIDSSMQTAHIMSAIIDRLRVGDLEIFGTLKSLLLDTINSQAGETINAPTPTYWPGSALVNHCASLTDGWHAVDNASTFGGKNITHVVKGPGTDHAIEYQSDPTEEAVAPGSTYSEYKSLTSVVEGKARIVLDVKSPGLFLYTYWQITKNGSVLYSGHSNAVGEWDDTYFNDITLAVGDVVKLLAYAESNIFSSGNGAVANFDIIPAANTIGIWNNTDNTAKVIEPSAYYNLAGNIDVTGLSDFTTTDYDEYWLGSEFIGLFSGKITNFRTLDLGGGTFNGKTCETIYKNGALSVTLGFTDTTTLTISSASYYTHTGSVILPTVEDKILFGNPSAEGQYEFWSHNIPGTTDNIITWRNIKTGKIFSILEVRAPDVASGDSESTLSLHGVVGDGDFVNDKSMHNYSGTMKVVDVFSNFGASGALGAWEWWRKKYYESSAAKVASIDANNGNLETIGEVKGASAAITGNASVGGNLSVTGGVSGSGGTLTSTQLNSYKIDDDSSPIATRSSGLVDSGQRSSLFSVYKPITVAFSSGSTSSFYLQVYRNGSYYNVLTNSNDAVSLNPGRYAFYNFSASDSISADIACVGAYGTADGSSIWS